MYAIAVVGALFFLVFTELLRIVGVPRKTSYQGLHSVCACAIVGGAAQVSGESFSVYSSMYAFALMFAWLGPLFAALPTLLRRRDRR